MRIKILTLIFISCLTVQVHGQEEKSQLVWGCRLGLNYSSVRGSNSQGYDIKTGGTIGIFSRIKLSEIISLQPEFNYTSKGMSQETVIDDNPYEFTLAFTYLETPLLIKYNFGTDLHSGFKPDIFFGPFGAFKINSEITLVDDITGNSIDIANVSGFDWGIAFGGSAGFPVDNVDVFLELRFTYSIPSYDNSSPSADLRHTVFTLSLGFAVN